MSRIKLEKGITLIALIITIIVLLILAVVAISAVQDEGIIMYAQNARDKYTIAQDKEEIMLVLDEWKIISSYSDHEETFFDFLEEKFGYVTYDGDNWIIQKKSGKQYKVKETGEISLLKEELKVEELESTYEFEYYSSLSGAIKDINGIANDETISDKDDAVAGVYTDENNKPVVVLLQDTTETKKITISKDIRINLGGNRLSLTENSYIEVASGVNTLVIDGRLSGSSIEQTANTATVYGINNLGNKITIIGGAYNFTHSTSEDSYGINCATGTYIISNSSIAVISTSTTAEDNKTYGVYSAGGVRGILRNDTINISSNQSKYIAGCYVKENAKVDLETCKINVVAKNSSHVYGIYNPKGNTIVRDCSINVSGDDGSAKGACNFGRMEINNTEIFADAPGCSAGNNCAVGITNYGTLIFNSGSVVGTNSGLGTHEGSKTYIYGGTFKSCCHGGIYFAHGPTGEAYVENATIMCEKYSGKYDGEAKQANHMYGGFYIGGGSEEYSSDMKVHMNNCTIKGGTYAFVLRGSNGEQNNTVYISNSTIGENKIRIDNDTHKLYIGQGCNFTAENTGRPSAVVITDNIYTNPNK